MQPITRQAFGILAHAAVRTGPPLVTTARATHLALAMCARRALGEAVRACPLHAHLIAIALATAVTLAGAMRLNGKPCSRFCYL